MESEILKGLITSSPLTALLLLIVKVLWSENQLLRKENRELHEINKIEMKDAHKEILDVFRNLSPGESTDGEQGT